MPDWWFPYGWLILPGLAGLLALTLLAAGLGALTRRRPVSGLLGVISSGAMLALGAALLMLGLNIQTYSRLTYERPVATIELHRTGEQAFDATLTEAPAAPDFGQTRPAPPPQTFSLAGDEWRIEAKVLKWKPWVNALGLDSRYRLERLAGEFTDSAAEQTGPRTVIDLRQPAEEGRMANLAHRLNRAHLIDTVVGSAAIMPAVDGARYELSMTQSGLVARPANDAAGQAVGMAR
jgi:hypothetical protein